MKYSDFHDFQRAFKPGSRLKAQQLSWNVGWTCNNADTIKAAVIAGLGISVISARAVEKEAAAGELAIKPVAGVGFFRTFKIAYHKNKYLTAQMKNFIEEVLKWPS